MGEKSGGKDEPDAEVRCPSSPRQDVTYQLVETSPVAPRGVRAAAISGGVMASRTRTRPAPASIAAHARAARDPSS